MGHKEYGVTNIIDILRRAKARDSFRRIARAATGDLKEPFSWLLGFVSSSAHPFSS